MQLVGLMLLTGLRQLMSLMLLVGQLQLFGLTTRLLLLLQERGEVSHGSSTLLILLQERVNVPHGSSTLLVLLQEGGEIPHNSSTLLLLLQEGGEVPHGSTTQLLLLLRCWVVVAAVVLMMGQLVMLLQWAVRWGGGLRLDSLVKITQTQVLNYLYPVHTVNQYICYNVKLNVCVSIAAPNSKDPHHFAGSGFEIFSTDPDSDLNLARFKK